ncbi:MAG: helix-turn-helix domain-containing protein [Candidatus Ornithobacterium hominis]|nr:helix-turn-helix domain-containing protein [Candidatus Ornithobacterium hominis]MCT7903707.1 helix-turn-helix domain-containing protein [Candidatus Ornithobacterium hominis]
MKKVSEVIRNRIIEDLKFSSGLSLALNIQQQSVIALAKRNSDKLTLYAAVNFYKLNGYKEIEIFESLKKLKLIMKKQNKMDYEKIIFDFLKYSRIYNLTSSEISVYMILISSFKNNQEQAFVLSDSELSKLLSLSRPTIKKALKKLESLNFISMNQKRGRKTIYTINNEINEIQEKTQFTMPIETQKFKEITENKKENLF